MICKRESLALIGLLLAVALALPVWAQQTPPAPPMPTELVVDGKVAGKAVEPRSGEICLVCNLPIGDGDVAYLVHGQRVAVHREVCNAKLLEHSEAVLAQLRPRGAFLGAEVAQPGLASSWFLFGLYVLTGLIFGALCAHYALHAGLSPMAWFSGGLAFNVFGFVALLTRPRRAIAAPGGVPSGLGKIAATHAPASCLKCGAAFHPSAARCPDCGAELSPNIVSEVALALGAK